ncbi:endolytic transglycosylase MltG [Vagococcus xieshaowenii]|uniref:Endolytic murein transglycosylase n=1 Tax=Vagococcus xieshaowenii TaxID=2562451 RepID=A0AAJ5EGA6_9ENTE|nr:endolytic transglycosylase MltG [Vagococcus xieshaowenii]QCA28362.1 endolytic transglycosylase MltG [Vagococcus xieshaowenii]TFZ42250.1 endolytic transglycosylase MltG [Vagococcus xieshaowenii]
MRRKQALEKENRTVRRIVTTLVSALLVMAIVLGIFVYRYWQTGTQPLDTNNSNLQQVNIPIGTSNKGIGNILEENHIIKSGLVFNYYMKLENQTDFKGGYYQMSPDMTLDDIAEMLKQGGSEEPSALADGKISVPEGYSLEQVAEVVGDSTDISTKEFIDTANDPAFLKELYEAYPELLASTKEAKEVRYHLEGYLFPATYNYYKDKTAKDIIKEMVDKTNQELLARKEQIDASHHSIQEILTLASLVEKEGVTSADRRNIARVFLNRLDTGMRIESDITILYALQKHKVHLSYDDLEVVSPYNLYRNDGLGPGPFNNPGIDAIDAVLDPADNNYYYFLANVETGKVYFAETYEEHLQLKEEHIDNLNN